MAKGKEVAVAQETSVMAVIHDAVQKGVSVEILNQLFDLQKRVKEEKAREAFTEALAKFQGECPIIEKKKEVKNKDGSLRYKFAPIDSIVEQIKKPLARADLSYRWETKQEGRAITAICIVTHALGHCEKSDFTVEIDTEGFMTAPQKAASALTFAKRYSLLNALGISTGDEDLDATDVKKEPKPKSDKSKIIFLLGELKDPAKTVEEYKATIKKRTDLELVPQNFPEIISRLEFQVQEMRGV